ncbi:NUDIX hydrolase [Denitrovibrio acetiphilus DSM 12809]|uniref:NUDIX hydrolase n=1 Tax=Denitrovibrio acetiphilus (strain DSM 12809 / NBRC 114555 / N2460) TaxID=522772 RepID=D4H6L6_DENA2|nr:NUDIX hydrolase [Denitrovibrio acetiphilus]ADD69690.1 NUDIX hydrolase [Denitrovibrio acetiphilus DSM 12809]
MTFSAVPEYFYRQSGAIPYRVKNGELQVLLITSRKSRKWIIPKGVVEPYMTPQESAAQEAYEEAGVFGRVWDEPVGVYEVEKWGGLCTVTVFPMLVTKVYEDWMEGNFRKRKWFKAEKAIDAAGKQKLRALIKKFVKEFSVKI